MSSRNQITLPPRKAAVLEFSAVARQDARLLLPREHGSWALWLLPLLSGAIVGYSSTPGAAAAPALWLLLVAAAAFLIHQPLEALLGTSLVRVRLPRERELALLWISSFLILAALGALELLRWHRRLILVFAPIALACVVLTMLFGHRRALRVPKQMVGALGLSAAGAGAYYVTTGRFDLTALLLWLAAWLFAATQIEYVQLRLRTAKVETRAGKVQAGWRLAFLHLILVGATIVAAATALPNLLGLMFVPATLRMFAWMLRPPSPLRLYVLGFTELLQNIAFNALLTASLLMRH